MITTCPICGKSLKEGEIFCPNCKALLFDDDTDSGQLSKNKMTNFTQNAISKREETWQEKFLTAEGRLNRKPYILRGWFLSCTPYIGGISFGDHGGTCCCRECCIRITNIVCVALLAACHSSTP